MIEQYIWICASFMHLSSAFPGWGTPGGITNFYIKVTQFSEPSGMIWKQSLHPGENRNMLTKPHVNRDNGSHPLMPENVPNPRAIKRPRRPERPRYWGALFFNFSWFPPGNPGVHLPGKADDKCISKASLFGDFSFKSDYQYWSLLRWATIWGFSFTSSIYIHKIIER